MPFVKLDCNILDSTLWLSDPEVRVTFITMLAMASPYGLVAGRDLVIAREANLPVHVTKSAIKQLIDLDEIYEAKKGVGYFIKRRRSHRAANLKISFDDLRFLRPPFLEWEQTRKRIFERDRYRCTYCGDKKFLECDHIVPVSKGGSHDDSNLTTACRSCNRSKKNHDLRWWLAMRWLDDDMELLDYDS